MEETYEQLITRQKILCTSRRLADAAVAMAIEAADWTKPNINHDARWDALTESYETLRSTFAEWLELHSPGAVGVAEVQPPF
jgi:hypothetical protein